MPLLYYTGSEDAYLYDSATLAALWEKVADLRSLDMKMIGVLWIPELQSRTDLNWMDAVQTKDEAKGWSRGGRLCCQGTLAYAKPFILQV